MSDCFHCVGKNTSEYIGKTFRKINGEGYIISGYLCNGCKTFSVGIKQTSEIRDMKNELSIDKVKNQMIDKLIRFGMIKN